MNRADKVLSVLELTFWWAERTVNKPADACGNCRVRWVLGRETRHYEGT